MWVGEGPRGGRGQLGFGALEKIYIGGPFQLGLEG
jgi:hypothetical protein